MTIKELSDFYFTQYPELKIRVDMWGGLCGRYILYTKDKFEKWIKGYENEKVMTSNFQTHYHNHVSGDAYKCDFPILYICYLAD